MSTHAVVACNLVIDGKVVGLHWFIVPLRDKVDGHLLPGVAAGYVGTKQGRHGLDNGWIQFTHVRIPRENMLMRWATVSPDGTYKALKNQAVAYGTLIGERLVSVHINLFSNILAIQYWLSWHSAGRNLKLRWASNNHCSSICCSSTSRWEQWTSVELSNPTTKVDAHRCWSLCYQILGWVR